MCVVAVERFREGSRSAVGRLYRARRGKWAGGPTEGGAKKGCFSTSLEGLGKCDRVCCRSSAYGPVSGLVVSSRCPIGRSAWMLDELGAQAAARSRWSSGGRVAQASGCFEISWSAGTPLPDSPRGGWAGLLLQARPPACVGQRAGKAGADRRGCGSSPGSPPARGRGRSTGRARYGLARPVPPARVLPRVLRAGADVGTGVGGGGITFRGGLAPPGPYARYPRRMPKVRICPAARTRANLTRHAYSSCGAPAGPGTRGAASACVVESSVRTLLSLPWVSTGSWEGFSTGGRRYARVNTAWGLESGHIGIRPERRF